MASPKQKTNTLAELRALEAEKLAAKIADLRRELVAAQRAHKAGELPSPAVITKTRKHIAKALTVLKEKTAAPAPQPKEQEK